jgi:hypothetical protein
MTVTVDIKGGIGNQIFQIACALEYSSRYNNKLILAKNLINTNKHQHNDINKTLSVIKILFPDIEIIDYIDTKSYSIYEEKMDEAFKYIDINKYFKENNKNTDNILLIGYFITEKYFPSKLLCNIVPSNMQNISNTISDFSNMYFIHIRLGDYVNSRLHSMNLEKYYTYCINKIKEKDGMAKFIICTNEYSENLYNYINNFPKNNTYILQDSKNDEMDTLYIMSSCKGAICANSTLSWLGAYFQKDKNMNKDKGFIFMPYPWINFINGYNKNNIMDVYPKWTQVYDITTNSLM